MTTASWTHSLVPAPPLDPPAPGPRGSAPGCATRRDAYRVPVTAARREDGLAQQRQRRRRVRAAAEERRAVQVDDDLLARRELVQVESDLGAVAPVHKTCSGQPDAVAEAHACDVTENQPPFQAPNFVQ